MHRGGSNGALSVPGAIRGRVMLYPEVGGLGVTLPGTRDADSWTRHEIGWRNGTIRPFGSFPD